MINTDEFYRKMVVFKERADAGEPIAREAAIKLIEDTLIELGYGRGVGVFQKIREGAANK